MCTRNIVCTNDCHIVFNTKIKRCGCKDKICGQRLKLRRFAPTISRVERCGSLHFDDSLNKNVVITATLVYNFHVKGIAVPGALIERSLPLI